jgi:hypothetical protein
MISDGQGLDAGGPDEGISETERPGWHQIDIDSRF